MLSSCSALGTLTLSSGSLRQSRSQAEAFAVEKVVQRQPSQAMAQATTATKRAHHPTALPQLKPSPSHSRYSPQVQPHATLQVQVMLCVCPLSSLHLRLCWSHSPYRLRQSTYRYRRHPRLPSCQLLDFCCYSLVSHLSNLSTSVTQMQMVTPRL